MVFEVDLDLFGVLKLGSGEDLWLFGLGPGEDLRAGRSAGRSWVRWVGRRGW